MPAKNQKKKMVKAGEQPRSEVQYPASADNTNQEGVETTAQKIDKQTLDKPCKDVLAFSEKGKVLLFKK